METTAGDHVQQTCGRCHATTSRLALSQSDFRCPQCGQEMAYVDLAPNGTVRGVFGFLRNENEILEDRYQIEKFLGKGGFGATYFVRDLKLKGKRRALKEVPTLMFDETEVNVLSQLHHPSIPDILDRFEKDGMVYLILEFGGSQTLSQYCKAQGGRIPLSVALPWMRQVCEALDYLHSQSPPIIHRDLKPDNILVDENNRVMLIDFGISKESDESVYTRTVARAASLGFSPPEQVLGTGTDERSDIYAFGATFYYVLTGTVPPGAHERVAGKDLVPVKQLAPETPSLLCEMVEKSLRLNMNERPQTIREILDVLEQVEGGDLGPNPHAMRTVRLGSDFPTASTRSSASSRPVSRPIIIQETAQKGTDSPSRKRILIAMLVLLGLSTLGALGYHVLKKPAETASQDNAVQKPTRPAEEARVPSEGKGGVDNRTRNGIPISGVPEGIAVQQLTRPTEEAGAPSEGKGEVDNRTRTGTPISRESEGIDKPEDAAPTVTRTETKPASTQSSGDKDTSATGPTRLKSASEVLEVTRPQKPPEPTRPVKPRDPRPKNPEPTLSGVTGGWTIQVTTPEKKK